MSNLLRNQVMPSLARDEERFKLLPRKHNRKQKTNSNTTQTRVHRRQVMRNFLQPYGAWVGTLRRNLVVQGTGINTT